MKTTASSIQLLSERIKEGRVISLIQPQALISEDGKVGKPNTIGTPQGGVISLFFSKRASQ